VTLGGGADVVHYSMMSSTVTGISRIADFQTGDSGDRLKITTPFTNLGTDPFGSGYLRLVQDGADVLVQYDLDGASTGRGWVTLVTLAGVDSSALTPYNLSGYGPGAAIPAGLVLAGTSGDDRIHGNYGADQIDGGDGDDLIEGLGGDDSLSGGLGADRLVGESGADHLLGGDGDDDLSGGDGNDLLEGGEGADSISLGYGDDVAFGGAGDDSIVI
jgi:Ca2+-binding RTX toxin-like protein